MADVHALIINYQWPEDQESEYHEAGDEAEVMYNFASGAAVPLAGETVVFDDPRSEKTPGWQVERKFLVGEVESRAFAFSESNFRHDNRVETSCTLFLINVRPWK